MRYGRELEQRMSSNELILGILRMQNQSTNEYYCYEHINHGNLVQTHFNLRTTLELRNEQRNANSYQSTKSYSNNSSSDSLSFKEWLVIGALSLIMLKFCGNEKTVEKPIENVKVEKSTKKSK